MIAIIRGIDTSLHSLSRYLLSFSVWLAMAGTVANGHYPVAASPPALSTAPPSTSPETVGNQFVNQFYTVMKSSPRYLHRFYTDESTFTHVDPDVVPDGMAFTVNNQKNIHDRVMALGFDESQVDLYTMDSQYSLGHGVIVQVTGALGYKGQAKRNFVQCFFLAVQERGYFVLNDCFRYISDKPAAAAAAASEENGHAVPAPLSDKLAAATPNGAFQPQQQQASHTAVQHPPPIPSRVPPPMAAPPTEAPQQQHAPPPPPTDVQASLPQPVAMHQHSPPGRGFSHPTALENQPQARAPPPPTQQQQQPPQQRPPQPAPIPSKPAAAAASSSSPQSQAPSASSAAAPTAAPAPEAPSSAPAAAAKAPEAPEAPPAPAQQEGEGSEAAGTASPEAEAAPAVPQTYADRLKKGVAQKPAAPPPAKPLPSSAATTGPSTPPTPPTVNNRSRPQSPTKAAGDGANGIHPTQYHAEDAPCTAVFVRDFPPDITAEKLEEAFTRFGTVKNGVKGVNLKTQRGKDSFAFVEFEEASAVPAAIEGQVLIGGQQLTVTEKRPMMMGGRGSRGGRDGYSRGRGDRGGFSGRSGGRGDGRGDGRGRGRGYSGPLSGDRSMSGDGARFGGRTGGRSGELGGRGDGRGRRGGRDSS
ncbi:hypothetical protein WJX73_010835 [Symbiochloris irregularis]|uniref:G3BP-like protein n=1 Tax=Symbiochloris irregularis TaxID=706552 RepID=A0AAW1PSV1_9CHLO